MKKKHIITIAGDLGGGKSSTAKGITEVLEYKHFSSGDFMREVGLKKNVNLMERSEQAEKDKSIDKEIDEKIREVGKGDNLVIDSRLAYHWIPESFKVYLKLDPEIAKKRIFEDLNNNPLRKESEGSESEDEIYQKIIKRRESEKKRYKEIYNLDNTDPKNFDLVVDTSKHNLQEVIQIIKNEYINWLR